jgi:tRNA A-37 threonylcarbamoyl transferase component Bud32
MRADGAVGTSVAGLEILGSGREADVYALDAHRVLRRYRDSERDAVAEAVVMRHAARHGFPVPEVLEVAGADLVMARADGPTLLASLVAGDTDPVTGGGMLAGLQAQLHTLPPCGHGDPRRRILHLDLHPDNVILTASGPVLIDWCNATEGAPECDIALTALILAEAAVGLHGISIDALPLAREVLASFLRRSAGDPLTELARAVARRAADPHLSPDEKRRLAEAAGQVRAARAG